MGLFKFSNIIKFASMGPTFLQSFVRKVPFYVNFDLTWQCNLNCAHCYFMSSTSELKNKRTELSREKWVEIFKYHRNLGTKIAVLTGGEPTLRMDVIKEAIKIFPSVQVVSNGIIKLPQFDGFKQPMYWVSLDGTKETHNKIRGAKIFDKVIQTVRESKAVVSAAIHALNYEEIEDIAKIAYDNGASGLVFLLHTSYPDDPLLLKGDILRKAIKNILKVMREYGNFIFYSRKMLELYLTKEFVPHCIFKTGQIKSFYPDGTQKFCVMGNSPLLCENCGCVVPIVAYALFRKFDAGTVDKSRKLFNL
ncbi:MAG: radical SAM protein [Promethearchaeota archaeon]